MKNKKLAINKQKIALIGLLIAVAVGGFMFFQNSPETEVAPQAVAEAPPVVQPEVQAQQPVQEQPAAPIEAEAPPAQTLGASSSGLGR